MGLWSTFKSSYTSHGIFSQDNNWHSGGFGDAFKMANPGMRRPAEGFAHAIKRGIIDNTIEIGNTGFITHGADKVRYGGSIFSSGGRREIMHEAEQIGSSGLFKLGARRGTGSMLWHGAGKLVAPAMFLYTAAHEGIGEATKQSVEQGAMFGAARWAWGRAVAAVGSPLLLGATAIAGAGIAAQKAMVMGKRYGENMNSTVGFGNPYNDLYGNAATMRQASMMAIQSSKINGRNALGCEASMFHLR